MLVLVHLEVLLRQCDLLHAAALDRVGDRAQSVNLRDGIPEAPGPCLGEPLVAVSRAGDPVLAEAGFFKAVEYLVQRIPADHLLSLGREAVAALLQLFDDPPILKLPAELFKVDVRVEGAALL